MKSKKVLHFLVTLILVCTLFSGCAGNITTDTDTPAGNDEVSGEVGSGENYTEETTPEETTVEKTTPEETTPEETTTEEILDDGMKDTLVAAAKVARDAFMIEFIEKNGSDYWNECAAFYDFNLDGVPEYCLMRPDAGFIVTGDVFIYNNGEYVKFNSMYSSIYNYPELKTYKNAEGNTITIETDYYHTWYNVDLSNEVECDAYAMFVLDMNNQNLNYFGTHYSKSYTNPDFVSVYKDSTGTIVSEEEFNNDFNTILAGYELQENCGGDFVVLSEDISQSFYDAYNSYLKNIK